MTWTSDFLYQLIVGVVFAVSLGFFFYFLAEKQQGMMLWSGFLAWVCIGASVAIKLNERVLVESETEGYLVASNEPSPSDPPGCVFPSGAMRLFLGSSLAYTHRERMNVVKVGEDVLLSISKAGTGILVDAKLYSRDKKIVAEIEKNVFRINPNNYFKRRRPDKHTLVVFDQEGTEVLNIRFLNSQTVKITGRFLYPNRAPIVVEENRVSISGNYFYEACFGDAATAIHVN